MTALVGVPLGMVIVGILGPVLLLRSLRPILVCAGIVAMGDVAQFITPRALKKLPDKYRHEAEEDNSV
ncbi:hypothetical protein [Arthrobacter sp. B1I2]|uniref:hypothetical protein n=1 Tax=Arthrobacter sp. B1I2 TaxID=3042263 RepID=UPI002780C838|nr:hypothetical protein [Arthrobacter sp. B1I2]MDQ0732205.1 hypothetical protein [Arthrobacter sp. B1I2]